MRRLIAVVVLAGASFGGYRFVSASFGPVAHYEKFAEALLHRRYDAAAAMCDGLTAADLEKLGSQERIGAGPPMFQSLFPSLFDIQSRKTMPDGSTVIHAVQTVRFNPAGVESGIRPAMFATLEQVVTLRNGSGGWKVVSFENTFMKMDSTSR
jgi:hypothetical protein